MSAAPLATTAQLVPARWATPRTPGRRTFGPAVAALAAALGTPLMPWQRQVADVALEVLDDGGWAYRTVLVTVPRQAGKTTLTGPVHLHRAMTRPARGDGRARTYFTAQSRQDARDTWLDIIERVRASPIAQLAKIRESNGSESCSFGSGGFFRLFAPTEDALHGKPCQLVTVDEQWAFDGTEGAALEQAIRPTFTTTGGQLWFVSTAGTARSTWMRGYVDRGRAGVDQGARTGLAYFEWSLTPEDALVVAGGLEDGADPADRARALDLVVAHHPAHGHTLDRGAVEDAAANMTPGEFLRAYGNVWTATAERAIPAHVWTAAGDDGRRTRWPDPPELGAVALAFDVALDRSAAAIVAAWRPDPTGPLRLDVVDAHEGTSWLVPRVRELVTRWRPAVVGHDRAGPVLDVADELARGGLELVATRGLEYAAACQALLSGLTARRVEHRNQPQLDQAVEAAAVRAIGSGEGQWQWSRRQSSDNIAPLVASTVAAWLADHRPAPAAAPMIVARRRR